MNTADPSAFHELASFLRKRREIIADHAFRDRDPDAHLAALVEVSEHIAAQQQGLREHLPPRLAHFLDQCSYDKALSFIEEQLPQPPASHA